MILSMVNPRNRYTLLHELVCNITSYCTSGHGILMSCRRVKMQPTSEIIAICMLTSVIKCLLSIPEQRLVSSHVKYRVTHRSNVLILIKAHCGCQDTAQPQGLCSNTCAISHDIARHGNRKILLQKYQLDNKCDAFKQNCTFSCSVLHQKTIVKSSEGNNNRSLYSSVANTGTIQSRAASLSESLATTKDYQ